MGFYIEIYEKYFRSGALYLKRSGIFPGSEQNIKADKNLAVLSPSSTSRLTTLDSPVKLPLKPGNSK